MSDSRITYRTDPMRRLLARAPEILIEELRAAVTEGSMLLEREVRERTPTSGAGTLRESIGALPVSIGGGQVAGGVATSLAYAVPVELGTKPHRAPIAPLVDWVRRKLGASGPAGQAIARAIQVKIARAGTKGAFMFRDGFAAVERQVMDLLDAAVARAAARIAGGGR